MKKNIIISLDEELEKKFEIALTLTAEVKNDVIESLIKKYISEAFILASKMTDDGISKVEETIDSKGTSMPNYLNPRDQKYGKARKKIPLWAHRRWQINHKIIKAYYEIENEIGFVTPNNLKERCVNKKEFPNTYCANFDSNFAAMRTDASNTNGKVFVIENNEVRIWEVVKDVLDENKKHFC